MQEMVLCQMRSLWCSRHIPVYICYYIEPNGECLHQSSEWWDLLFLYHNALQLTHSPSAADALTKRSWRTHQVQLMHSPNAFDALTKCSWCTHQEQQLLLCRSNNTAAHMEGLQLIHSPDAADALNKCKSCNSLGLILLFELTKELQLRH